MTKSQRRGEDGFNPSAALRSAAPLNKGSQSPQNKKQKLQQSRVVTKKLQKRMAKGRLQEKRVKTAWLSGKVLINHHKK